jgi:(p)ppGpp synthase/HD superfamily hydrolase
MSDLNTAIRIAAAAHSGQEDKQGGPYITHPLRVMNLCTDPRAQIVAVLHDVVEDTDTTLDELRGAGFSTEILEAVRCATHPRGVTYTDYIVRLKANPIARQVKLADLTDNSRIERLLMRPEKVDKDLTRMARYLFSYKFLTDGLSEPQYRELMERYAKERD